MKALWQTGSYVTVLNSMERLFGGEKILIVTLLLKRVGNIYASDF